MAPLWTSLERQHDLANHLCELIEIGRIRRGKTFIGGNDDREVVGGDDVEHLPAKAPPIRHDFPLDLTQEPAIAIAVAGDARRGAFGPGRLNPLLGYEP